MGFGPASARKTWLSGPHVGNRATLLVLLNGAPDAVNVRQRLPPVDMEALVKNLDSNVTALPVAA